MDQPGSSLFQGVESIKINNDLQRIEEEDAIEDRLRRNEEVNNHIFVYFVRNSFTEDYKIDGFFQSLSFLDKQPIAKCI